MPTDRPSGQERLSRSEQINIRIAVTQTVLALVGIFLGAVALYAALNESEAVRKQTEASVWPRLLIGRSFSNIPGAEDLSIAAMNAGIGPATIESVLVTVDDQPKKTWFDVIEAITGQTGVTIDNGFLSGAVLRPGDTSRALRVDGDIAIALRDAYDAQRLVIKACYCSVFGDCWMQSTIETDAAQARSCPNYDEDAFEN